MLSLQDGRGSMVYGLLVGESSLAVPDSRGCNGTESQRTLVNMNVAKTTEALAKYAGGEWQQGSFPCPVEDHGHGAGGKGQGYSTATPSLQPAC